MPLTAPNPNIGSTGWGEAVNQFFTDLVERLTGLVPIEGAAIDNDLNMLGHEILNAADISGLADPTNLFTAMDTRYYTQDEVNEIIAGAIFSFWPSDTADGVIGGYNRMYDADTAEAKSSIGPVTINAPEVLIKPFITAIAQPDFTVLSEGVYSFDIHASSTVGAPIKNARLRWRLYRRTQPGGVETLLITSEDGEVLTATEFHYQVHGTLPAEVNLDTTDRLVLKLYAIQDGTEPNNPDVTIFMEGVTSTRIEVRTNLTAFDNRYLMRNGSNSPAADIDWGGFKITNVGTVDGVDVSALQADVNGFPDQLKQLLTVEIQQLENIGATTISPAQWALLGAAPTWDHFVDRGDPATHDWDELDLTTDGTWRDLDVSAIVPANATLILFRIRIIDNLVGMTLGLREKGNANPWNIGLCQTSVSNTEQGKDLLVVPDANRVIQYWTTNTVWTVIRITVGGWWLP